MKQATIYRRLLLPAMILLLLPPLSCLPGLGLSAAMNLAEVREKGRFVSREDMIRRKIGKAVVETLANAGCLGDIPSTSQMSLFELGM